ncbi:MAG: hypothetical protein MUF83_13085 [Acidimicrobiales bacterium]|nr:hypothetical protein [Acidimicrobiales bacterium]
MTIYEFFIEPVGSVDRFETGQSAALTMYGRLTDLIETGQLAGSCTPASAEARSVDLATVLELIGGVAGDWYHGRQREPARGPEIAIDRLVAELDRWRRFDLRYFET